MRYNHGPLFKLKDPDNLSVVATFQSELRGKKKNFPPLMKDSPAIVLGRSGKGYVCLMSPYMFDGEPAVHTPLQNVFFTCGCGISYPIGEWILSNHPVCGNLLMEYILQDWGEGQLFTSQELNIGGTCALRPTEVPSVSNALYQVKQTSDIAW